MHTNGTLKYWVNPNPENDGLDDKGNPINLGESPDVEWSEPIPCLTKVNKRDNVGYIGEDSKFQTARYIVHIETDSFDDNATIQLTDDLDRDLGRFKVRDIQHSDLCNRIQLMI